MLWPGARRLQHAEMRRKRESDRVGRVGAGREKEGQRVKLAARKRERRRSGHIGGAREMRCEPTGGGRRGGGECTCKVYSRVLNEQGRAKSEGGDEIVWRSVWVCGGNSRGFGSATRQGMEWKGKAKRFSLAWLVAKAAAEAGESPESMRASLAHGKRARVMKVRQTERASSTLVCKNKFGTVLMLRSADVPPNKSVLLF